MKSEGFLPIGTVVMLKGGRKRVMITGFLTYGNDEKDKLYDYNGCMYPEGVISSTTTLLFNHDQIEKVYYTGLIDEEEKEFKEKLKKAVEGGAANKEEKPQEEKPLITEEKPLISEEKPIITEEAKPVEKVEENVDTIPIISFDE